MLPDALQRQIQQDRQDGLIPCFVSTTIGTTSSNVLDPLPEIGRICKEENVWLHVDGAMSGTAAVCPEFPALFEVPTPTPTSAPSATPTPEPTAIPVDRLQRVLDILRERYGVPGASATIVWPDGHTWTGVSGLSMTIRQRPHGPA